MVRREVAAGVAAGESGATETGTFRISRGLKLLELALDILNVPCAIFRALPLPRNRACLSREAHSQCPIAGRPIDCRGDVHVAVENVVRDLAAFRVEDSVIPGADDRRRV